MPRRGWTRDDQRVVLLSFLLNFSKRNSRAYSECVLRGTVYRHTNVTALALHTLWKRREQATRRTASALSSSCWLGCCFAPWAVKAENERRWTSPRRREETGEESMKGRKQEGKKGDDRRWEGTKRSV
jgi:hypothetical protein